MAAAPSATGGLGAAHRKKFAFAKKIAAQKNQGNSQKAQNLTFRYRAKVAARNQAAGDTSQRGTVPDTTVAAQGQFGSQYNTGKLSTKNIQKGLKKYSGFSAKSRKKTLKASRRLANTASPGTPGGTY